MQRLYFIIYDDDIKFLSISFQRQWGTVLARLST